MNRYFSGCTTLEELKTVYHKLVMQHHPDRGGDLETMQEIYAEYDRVHPALKNCHRNAKGEAYTKETNEAPEEFKDLMEKLIRMNGLIIEIIGCFVWLSGNTKEHKDAIKALGFRWSSNKMMWYKSPDGYKRHGKKSYDINHIRAMYGSTEYRGQEPDRREELTA